MPVFHAHIPEDRFTSAQKHALGAALPRALNDALGIPAEDQFVTIAEHDADSLFIDPAYGGVRAGVSGAWGEPRRRVYCARSRADRELLVRARRVAARAE